MASTSTWTPAREGPVVEENEREQHAGVRGRAGELQKRAQVPAIYLIQKELTAKGFACGSLDGCFGTKTKAALKRYQAAHGLEADGIFGKNTNAAMGLFEW